MFVTNFFTCLASSVDDVSRLVSDELLMPRFIACIIGKRRGPSSYFGIRNHETRPDRCHLFLLCFSLKPGLCHKASAEKLKRLVMSRTSAVPLSSPFESHSSR